MFIPKGKAKAKAKGPAPMKAGVFELSKVRASDLKESLPRFNRSETKKIHGERSVVEGTDLTGYFELSLTLNPK